MKPGLVDFPLTNQLETYGQRDPGVATHLARREDPGMHGDYGGLPVPLSPRWRLCQAIAAQICEGNPTGVWLMTRTLYQSNLPT